MNKSNLIVVLVSTFLLSNLSGCGDSTPKVDKQEQPIISEAKPIITDKEISVDPLIDPPPTEAPPPAIVPPKEMSSIEIDEPILATPLNVFTVIASREDNQLTVTWTDANADSYRVLFWDDQGELHEWHTLNTSQSIPSPLSTQAGQIIVEAYDALGSSIFSAPTNMGAL